MKKVLFCSRDLSLQKRILDSLCDIDSFEIVPIRSTKALMKNCLDKEVCAIAFDEDIYQMENFENIHSTRAIKVLLELNKRKLKIPFCVITKSYKGVKNLQNKHENVFYFNRDDIDLFRVISFFNCTAGFDFFPVLINDLKLGSKSPCNIYFAGKVPLSEELFIKKGLLLTGSFINSLKKRGSYHLYLKQEDLRLCFEEKNDTNTYRLYLTWLKVQKMLLGILDDSGKLTVERSNRIVMAAEEVINTILAICQSVTNPRDAFTLLPLPRINPVSICINNVIYAIILMNEFSDKVDNELLFASLLSMVLPVDYYLDKKNAAVSLEFELVNLKYFVHLKEKGCFQSALSQKYFEYENENIHGTGFPKGIILDQNNFDVKIINICKLIQAHRLVANSKLEKKMEVIINEIIASVNMNSPEVVAFFKKIYPKKESLTL